jgi:hypothetical protein
MRWSSIVVAGGIVGVAACGDGAGAPADATPTAADAMPVVADAPAADAVPPDATPPDAVPCANVLAGLGGDCMSAPVAVTTPSSETPNAEIAWTGSEYAIVWVDRDAGGARRIYLTRVDASGAGLGTVQLSQGTPDVYNPAIAWNGGEHGVTWTDSSNDVWFLRVSASGAAIGTPAVISEAAADAQGVAIAWGGDRYGVTWHDGRNGNSEIYFAALDATGAKLTSDVRVTTTSARSWMPVLAWTGGAFAIAYREDASTFSGRIFLALVDAAGVAAGGGVVSDAAAWVDGPTISWNGAQLVVVWDDNRATDRDLYAAFLDGAGVEAGPDVRITTTPTYSDEAMVAWNGTTYRVVWQEDIEPGPMAIQAADLDTAGTKLTTDVELAQGGLSPGMPRLVWTGDRYGVFWQVPVDASTRQLLYATLTPP